MRDLDSLRIFWKVRLIFDWYDGPVSGVVEVERWPGLAYLSLLAWNISLRKRIVGLVSLPEELSQLTSKVPLIKPSAPAGSFPSIFHELHSKIQRHLDQEVGDQEVTLVEYDEYTEEIVKSCRLRLEQGDRIWETASVEEAISPVSYAKWHRVLVANSDF